MGALPLVSLIVFVRSEPSVYAASLLEYFCTKGDHLCIGPDDSFGL